MGFENEKDHPESRPASSRSKLQLGGRVAGRGPDSGCYKLITARWRRSWHDGELPAASVTAVNGSGMHTMCRYEERKEPVIGDPKGEEKVSKMAVDVRRQEF